MWSVFSAVWTDKVSKLFFYSWKRLRRSNTSYFHQRRFVWRSSLFVNWKEYTYVKMQRKRQVEMIISDIPHCCTFSLSTTQSIDESSATFVLAWSVSNGDLNHKKHTHKRSFSPSHRTVWTYVWRNWSLLQRKEVINVSRRSVFEWHVFPFDESDRIDRLKEVTNIGDLRPPPSDWISPRNVLLT